MLPGVWTALVVAIVAVLASDIFFSVQRWRVICARGKNRPLGKPVGRELLPIEIDFKHALQFIYQKTNYKIGMLRNWVRVWWLRITGGRPVTTDDVVHYLINTGLAVFCDYIQVDDGLEITLAMEGFKFTLEPDRGTNNKLEVKCFIPAQCVEETERASTCNTIVNTLSSCKVHSFVFNNNNLHDPMEQLCNLTSVISTIVHPMEHAFFGLVYARRHDPMLQQYPDFFLHGQYLNEVAHEYTADCLGVERPWMRDAIASNAELGIRFHSNHLGLIKPYSRFVRFMWPARVALQRLMVKHGVNMDVEALFITTILHSIDHYFGGGCLVNHNLQSHIYPNACLNDIAGLTFVPSQFVMTNLLCHKHRRNAFYSDLYAQLVAIDKTLADNVTLSISY